MGVFYRDNADYVALSGYIGGAAPFGHSPIDLDLIALGFHYGVLVSLRDFKTAGGSVRLWVDGNTLDPEVNAGERQDIDPPITVPKVVTANVDGASRFGVVITGAASDASLVTVAYVPSNDADFGKQVMGIGSSALVRAASTGFLSVPQFWAGWPGAWFDGSGSDVFQSPQPHVGSNGPADFEISDAGALSGQVDGIGVVPMCRPAVWTDFTLALRAVPDGVYKFHLRVNHATVFTIATTNGGPRVISSLSEVQLHAGDLVGWLAEVVSGTAGLDGELLWTSRAQGFDSALGGGESGGEF